MTIPKGNQLFRKSMRPWLITECLISAQVPKTSILTNDADELIERNRRILGYEPPKPRDVLNLQNWISGNGCIAREETAYLDRSKDLLSISFQEDSAVTWLEALVEYGLFFLLHRFGRVKNLKHCRQQTQAEFVIAFSSRHLERPECAHISQVICNVPGQSPADPIHHSSSPTPGHCLLLPQQLNCQIARRHSCHSWVHCCFVWPD
jgi:hypothetical protein